MIGDPNNRTAKGEHPFMTPMDEARAERFVKSHAKRSRARSARVHANIMYAAADALEAESSELGLSGYVGVFGAAAKLRELAGAVAAFADEVDVGGSITPS